jgi:hypothetical protein
VETFKVTLTVIEPVEITGFVEDENEDKAIENLTPKLVERWGEDGYKIESIELADEDEVSFLNAALAEHKKELN